MYTIQETYKTTTEKTVERLYLALEVVYVGQGPVIKA